MKIYAYRLLDVFTDRPFGGNPLAVFTDARGLSDRQMQAIARELNRSETTFVLPARDAAHHYRVRIFTPLTELPSAGHPTIGTAFALALEERIRREQERQRVVFEEGSGPVSVMMESPMITIKQPAPEFGAVYEDRRAVAAMLGIDAARLDQRLPVQSVSCGVPYLLVPISDLDTIGRIRLRTDIWERTLSRSPSPHIAAFTQQTQSPTSDVHTRVFAPALGVPEDPATAAASGPIGSYLVHYGLIEAKPQALLVSEQGVEMGRPSFVHVVIEQVGGRVTSVRVGGQCVGIGEGRIGVEAEEG